jgi:hypothetical protein
MVGVLAAIPAAFATIQTPAQMAAGQPPCYTPSGQQYWTPGDAPCN